MRYLFILLISFNLFAVTTKTLLTLYEKKEYKQACLRGTKSIYNHKKDENFLSLYGFSCLKSGYIDRLATPIALLKSSAEARANSAYFSVILMQKKLLYHSLVDDYDLSKLTLPTTEYILSKVFDFYTKVPNQKSKKNFTFVDEDDKKRNYKLYLLQEDSIDKMIIEELYEDKLINKYIYW